METRTAHLRTAFHLFRRRNRASRSPGQGEIKSRRIVRSEKIQRSSDLFRQSAREIRSRANGVVSLQGVAVCPGGAVAVATQPLLFGSLPKSDREFTLHYVSCRRAFGAWKLPRLEL